MPLIYDNNGINIKSCTKYSIIRFGDKKISDKKKIYKKNTDC